MISLKQSESIITREQIIVTELLKISVPCINENEPEIKWSLRAQPQKKSLHAHVKYFPKLDWARRAFAIHCAAKCFSVSTNGNVWKHNPHRERDTEQHVCTGSKQALKALNISINVFRNLKRIKYTSKTNTDWYIYLHVPPDENELKPYYTWKKLNKYSPMFTPHCFVLHMDRRIVKKTASLIVGWLMWQQHTCLGQ